MAKKAIWIAICIEEGSTNRPFTNVKNFIFSFFLKKNYVSFFLVKSAYKVVIVSF
jgi:hypothetical protein